MIALDTNVLVRFLIRDDEGQAQSVLKRFLRAEQAGETFFIPLVVVLEVVWVLESVYQKERGQILTAVGEMLRLKIFKFERNEVVRRVLSDGKEKRFDLSDLIIALSAQACGCRSGLTFDKAAAKHTFFNLLK